MTHSYKHRPNKYCMITAIGGKAETEVGENGVTDINKNVL